MTITLPLEVETRLRERAEREGRDANSIAEAIIGDVLAWKEKELREEAEGVQRRVGSDSGR